MSEREPAWVGTWPCLTVRSDGHPARPVAVVVLDDAGRRNAMTDAMTSSWERVMGLLREDQSVAAVVVTGAGSTFCAGGDLAFLEQQAGREVDDVATTMLRFYRTWLALRDLPCPTIAAVNGAAVGAGLALAAAADLRVCARGALMSAPFTVLGIHPGMGSTHSLPRLFGSQGWEMLLMPEGVRVDEGLVVSGVANMVVAAEETGQAAVGLAQRVRDGAPGAVAATVATLRSRDADAWENALVLEARAQAQTLVSAEARAGVAAVRARTRPPWV